MTAIKDQSQQELSTIRQPNSEKDSRERQDDHRNKAAAWNHFIWDRGERYRTCRLGTFTLSCDEQREAITKLKAFCETIADRFAAGQGLLFFGPAGTGKDHLMAAMVFEAVAKLVDANANKSAVFAEWISGPKLFGRLRSAIGANKPEAECLSPLIHARLLTISDIGQAGTSLTDYQQQVLYQIIDARYSRYLPTWLTINTANRDELNAMVGVQIADRLVDQSLAIACNWPSHRKSLAL